MENPFQIMGARLREIRTTLDISTAEMAKVTGVSEEEYRLHESGVVDSSFAFLLRCAERFGIDIGALVCGATPKLSVYNMTRGGGGLPIKRRRHLNYQHMAPVLKERKVDPLYVRAQYLDGKMSIPLESHNGQEFDYVISGNLRIQIGEHIEELNPGDSILFDSSHPHGMVAADPAGCEFLAIVIKGDGEEDMLEFKSDTKIDSTPKRKLICEDFIEETLDSNGHLKSIKFRYPENFNFAYDVVDAIAARTPDKRALVWISRNDEKREFTFKNISDESKRAANYLSSLGIKKGDRVMLVLRRNYQFWIIINALHRIGAVAVPASNQLLTKDFVYRFENANIAAVICSVDGTITDNADEAAKKCPVVKNLISVDGKYKDWHNFDEEYTSFDAEYERPADLKATDPSIMFFSSGTTGFPKSVIHCFTYPLGHIVTARWWQCVEPDGLHLTISDTGWAKALWGKIYGQWLNECAVMVYDFDRFDAAKIMPLFAECGITSFCAPPTMYRFFIREDLSKYDFSGLRHAAIAGEALNPEVYHQFYRATGVKLMEGFGQTETTMVLGNVAGMNPKPGSMGKPNPQYKVVLMDSDGEEVRSGEVGEICIKAEPYEVPGLFVCYGNDEDTADAWHDGYYHTGDTAWKDEDGYYWYVGRTDDLIKSSGYRIGPFEIESVLMELPYVLECAVIGVPDPTRGQVVKAYITLTKGTVGTEALVKEIQEYVKTHTAPYKYPRQIEFIEQMPKTTSGKIRRTELRKMSSPEK